MRVHIRAIALSIVVGIAGYIIGTSAIDAQTPDQLPIPVIQKLPDPQLALFRGEKQDLVVAERFPSNELVLVTWRTLRSDGKVQVNWAVIDQIGATRGCGAAAFNDIGLITPSAGCQ